MSQKYQPGQTASINPSMYTEQEKDQFSGEFAALVKVVGSRYGKLEYPAELGYPPRIAIVWNLVSTSGKPFEKKYSTGIEWGTLADVSPDGARLISKSSDFSGLKSGSDALFLLRKAITAGFPAEQITDNISVFEGHCFFVTTDVNPSSKGSSKKAYPRDYHPEGFEATMNARAAKKAAASGGATMINTYAPAPVVAVSSDVVAAASMVLGEIVALAGGTISRNQIPNKINELAPNKGWSQKQRQDITLALWDLPTLKSVVTTANTLKIDGETVSFK